MSTKIAQAWSALMTLPEGAQDLAAEALLDYAGDRQGLSLTGEQIEEIERRLAEPEPKFLTLAEVRARFAQRRA